jgi:Cu(I)/Ag(I) efflux system membrane protein CusA/SilA
MSDPLRHSPESHISWADRVIRYSLENRVVVFLLLVPVVCWGVLVSPFDWNVGGPLRAPIPVDAIPDIGENQQIVFTEWPGRSPQDVEDQVTYPLTVSLLGISGVKAIRSLSMFGFSTVYVVFKDEVDFYWSRSRILERLNSLPQGTLPEGVQPTLGPDATGMGQVFWYLLEGQDRQGNTTGGWDLHELRTIQDWYVRFALLSAEGVSEVASVGGFVREYQVELDPDLMRAQEVTLNDVIAAVKEANRDVGARSVEVNRVEYMIRGVGFVKAVSDIQDAVIKLNEGVPVFVRNVARVTLGPASRSGALDKGGTEVVGGVVVVRYGENPLEVIKNVRKKMEEISVGLPRKTLPDGTVSQVRIVPFYDRTGLIHETLDTLSSALTDEILVTILVLVFMASHWGGSLLISSVLPLAIIICFIFMKLFGVAANVVALSGIAIAIGTLVDMGIIIVENILQHLGEEDSQEDRLQVVFRACREVGGAVLTAVSATIVSFLPVLTMEGAEGKLFRPLAYTKTFALFAALIVAVAVIPPLARTIFAKKGGADGRFWIVHEGLIYLGVAVGLVFKWWVGLAMALIGLQNLLASRLRGGSARWVHLGGRWFALGGITILLASHWLPAGVEKGWASNALFVVVLLGGVLAFFRLFQAHYARILGWCLAHKGAFLSLPAAILILGLTIWLGFGSLVAWLPKGISERGPFAFIHRLFPGLREEFMPPLDEGSYLFMPITMPHASIGEALDVLQKQDAAIQAIPEVETVVGKLGRAQSALDPAPPSMIETVVNYRPKYLLGPDGQRLRFRFQASELDLFRREDGTPVRAPDGRPYLVRGRFVRDEGNRLIPDGRGQPFRVWRPPLDPALNPGRKPWGGGKSP